MNAPRKTHFDNRQAQTRLAALSSGRNLWNAAAMSLIALAAALMLLLSACTPAPAETPAPTATDAPVVTEAPATPASGGMMDTYTRLEDFLAALQAADTPVSQGGPVEEPFFGSRAVHVDLNGQDIQVFEFASEAEQQAAAASITANGYIIGTTSVDWISPPYFFTNGNLIVLYVGSDAATLEHLSTLLGQPLTGPQ